jgi:hypothetical protein
MTCADRGTATMSGLQSLGQVTVLNDGSYLCDADPAACSMRSRPTKPNGGRWAKTRRAGREGLSGGPEPAGQRVSADACDMVGTSCTFSR